MSDQQTVWVISNIDEQKLLSLNVDRISKIAELPIKPPFAIILSKGVNQEWLKLLIEIRQRKEYRFTPIFYHGDVEPHLRHLFDGPATDDINQKAELVHERIANLSTSMLKADDKESLLLCYLYTRPDISLEGCKTHESSFIYKYPLLNLLFPDDVDFDAWRFLKDLVLRDLLIEDVLIDEIKTCSGCESGLLNIRTSCPSCHSIDIKPQKFVHCFSCGKLGTVPEFLRQERLICNRCNIKLHELGVDYEKPLEDKICNHCGHFFAEADVEIICLVCDRTSMVQELTIRRLYNYRLTRRSEYLARGIDKSIYRNFSHYFKIIDFSAFMSIVSWQAKLAERYSSVFFSLMSLEISNESTLINELGELESERLMGQFFTSLRQVFRESDLSSRMDNDMFFLMPLSGQDGCLIVIDRIKQAVEELANQGLSQRLIIGVSYMTSAEIIQNNLVGEIVVTELHTRMSESNSCVIGAGGGKIG